MNEDWMLTMRARAFAAAAHLGQKRKYTGDPYIVHPIAVADMVARKGGTTEMVAAALLHDVVEDTPVTSEEIHEKFGPVIGGLVDELTDEYTKENYPEWNRAKRKHAESIRLSQVSESAKIIKWCDMADNTTTIVEHDPGFAKVFLREKAELLERLGF